MLKIVHVAEYASGGVATYLRNLLELQINDSRVDEVTLINSKDFLFWRSYFFCQNQFYFVV